MKNAKKTTSLTILLMVMLVFFTSNVLAATINDDQSITIKIIHTNDIHSRYTYSEKNNTLGFAKLKTIINQEDADLTVDAGDIFHGQSFATIETGGSIAELMAAVGYDAMAAGNHDFNYGSARLLQLGNMANTKILGRNVVDIKTGQSFFADDYLIKTINVGGEAIKIGVFGLISPDIYSETAPANVAGLTFGNWDSTVTWAQESVSDLEAQGCDVIVALTHIGDSDNGELMRSDVIAKGAPGIDVIIDGHTHDIENRVVEETLIVQTGCFFSAVGQVDLTLDKESEQPDPEDVSYRIADKAVHLITAAEAKDDRIPADPVVASLTAAIEARQDPIKKQVVGSTPVKLGGETDNIWQDIRLGELNLGRVLADSYRFATSADIALENAGGVRAQIEAGDINKGQVIDVLPFGNYLVTKEIKGQAIRKMLETSIEIGVNNQIAKDKNDNSWPNNSGSYLQWSGLTAHYDLSKPVGERVFSVKVAGTELDNNQLYTVACSNYMAGSATYPDLQAAAIINDYPACDEAFISYLENAGEDRFMVAINTANITAKSQAKEIDPIKPHEPKKQTTDNPKTGVQSWPSHVVRLLAKPLVVWGR